LPGPRRPPTGARSAPRRCPRPRPPKPVPAARPPCAAVRATAASPPAASPVRSRARIPRHQHEGIICALAIARQDVIREPLRWRIGRQAVGESALDAVGREDQGVSYGERDDFGAEPRQVRPDDATPRDECRASPARLLADHILAGYGKGTDD